MACELWIKLFGVRESWRETLDPELGSRDRRNQEEKGKDCVAKHSTYVASKEF